MASILDKRFLDALGRRTMSAADLVDEAIHTTPRLFAEMVRHVGDMANRGLLELSWDAQGYSFVTAASSPEGE